MLCFRGYNKILAAILLILSTLLLSSCGKEGKSSNSSLKAEAQIVFENAFIAYITEDSRVFVITADNEAGGYMPGMDHVRKIYGAADSYLFLFMENGSFQIYNVVDHSFVTEKEVEKRLQEVEEGTETTGGYPLLLLFDFLLDVRNAEDAFCLGTDFAAACYNGEWEGSYRGCEALQWEHIVKYTGIYEPEMGLREDGTVIFRDPAGDTDEQLLADKISQWTNVVDIAEGFAYFGLLEDGTVVTPRPSEGYASDVTGWTDICHITAAPYVTAGLTNAGEVLVRSPHREEMFQAQEWENICYVYATTFSILGITAEGKILMTPAHECNISLQQDIKYPLPGFLKR